MRRLAVLAVAGIAGAAIVIAVTMWVTEETRWLRRSSTPTRARTARAGVWNESRRAGKAPRPTEREREILEQLETIGYLAGTRQGAGQVGVTRHVPGRASAGLNFYVSGHLPGAILMDMDGKVLHRWEKAFDEIWPASGPGKRNVNAEYWRRAHLFANGDVLVVFEGLGIARLDRRSEVVWANPVGAHHDLEVRPGSDIWVLTREARILEESGRRRPILEDFVTVLDEHGRIQRQVSLLQALEASETHAALFRRSIRGEGDIFHTNTLHALDGRLAERLPAFRDGNVLLSMRTLDAIAVLDMDAEEITWAYEGPFAAQHDPKIIDNGHLLLFNNRKGPQWSSVMELDPVTRVVVWEYMGTPPGAFYSSLCGTAQRLGNGDTLIVESENGRAFEVTPDKEIVWEFSSPHRAGEEDEYVATLFDLVRLGESSLTFLKRP